ncbi:MAG: hypothetical protein P8X90_08720 [Desulfobacterales bacterium]
MISLVINAGALARRLLSGAASLAGDMRWSYLPPLMVYFAVMAAFTNLALSASQPGTKYLNRLFVVERGHYDELGAAHDRHNGHRPGAARVDRMGASAARQRKMAQPRRKTQAAQSLFCCHPITVNSAIGVMKKLSMPHS